MRDDLKGCIEDAEEATSGIDEPELRRDAFKIILSKLLDVQLRVSSIQGGNNYVGNLDGTTPIVEMEANQFPVISPTNSTVSNIRSIFATEWASRRRTVNEINMALDAIGRPDPKHISTVLSRLVEAKELLRIKQGEIFVYWRNPAYESSQAQV